MTTGKAIPADAGRADYRAVLCHAVVCGTSGPRARRDGAAWWRTEELGNGIRVLGWFLRRD
jgi:hypothetical protein